MDEFDAPNPPGQGLCVSGPRPPAKSQAPQQAASPSGPARGEGSWGGLRRRKRVHFNGSVGPRFASRVGLRVSGSGALGQNMAGHASARRRARPGRARPCPWARAYADMLARSSAGVATSAARWKRGAGRACGIARLSPAGRRRPRRHARIKPSGDPARFDDVLFRVGARPRRVVQPMGGSRRRGQEAERAQGGRGQAGAGDQVQAAIPERLQRGRGHVEIAKTPAMEKDLATTDFLKPRCGRIRLRVSRGGGVTDRRVHVQGERRGARTSSSRASRGTTSTSSRRASSTSSSRASRRRVRQEGLVRRLALLYGAPRLAAVRATTAAAVWQLDRVTFEHGGVGASKQKQRVMDSLSRDAPRPHRRPARTSPTRSRSSPARSASSRRTRRATSST